MGSGTSDLCRQIVTRFPSRCLVLSQRIIAGDQRADRQVMPGSGAYDKLQLFTATRLLTPVAEAPIIGTTVKCGCR